MRKWKETGENTYRKVNQMQVRKGIARNAYAYRKDRWCAQSSEKVKRKSKPNVSLQKVLQSVFLLFKENARIKIKAVLENKNIDSRYRYNRRE